MEAEYTKGNEASTQVPQVPQESVNIIVEEKLNVHLSKDGGLESMEVQGTMMMEIQNEDDAFVKVKIDTGANEGYQFKTHPNIDKQLHANEGILGLKDPNRPFPCGSALGILKWRFQSRDESKYRLSSTAGRPCPAVNPLSPSNTKPRTSWSTKTFPSSSRCLLPENHQLLTAATANLQLTLDETNWYGPLI